MSIMGRYCKAYPIHRFESFSEWSANYKPPAEPNEDSLGLLYLQENLTVTTGIFQDENIVFDAVTPEWENFCANQLMFSLPEHLQSNNTNSESFPGMS